jgi:sulfite exporter TauE/SafE
VDGIALAALNGLTLGLASTLHCAGMCGAISSSLFLCQRGSAARGAGCSFALTHAGRVTAYVLAGAIVGAAGAPAIGWLDREAAFRLLQWAGAVALIWIGLSTAGIMPAFVALDRLLLPIADRVVRLTGRFQDRTMAPFAAGIAWGMMPCAMVYGALFTAMLTGSPAAGSAVMLAFGLGTVPGLLATSFGVRALSVVGTRRGARGLAGLGIALVGFLSVWISHPQTGALCLTDAAAAVSQSKLSR